MSLARLWQLETRDEWRAHIDGAADLVQYCACVENGRTFGALAGDAGVGTLGGSEDHAAILLGLAGRLSAFSFAPLRHLTDVRLPDDWRVVVATSGVAASKSGAERDAYNRLSLGAARLLELWNGTEPRAASLAAALASDADAGARLREIIGREAAAEWTADALERRLAHFEIEDALVPDAGRAVDCADAEAIGAIADTSQQRAEVLLGNQTPETIALARLARECGAFAASSFGAGFGGSVWALVAGDDAPPFADRWIAAYRQACPAAGVAAEAFVAPPGSGLVLRHSVS
jgi:galactokinase